MMERAFSVDDILGTFWKLDTHGEEGAAGGISEDPQHRVLNLDSEASGKQFNRSASEWAFQEFLKMYTPSFTSGQSSKNRVDEDPEEEANCLSQELIQLQDSEKFLSNELKSPNAEEMNSNHGANSQSGSADKVPDQQEVGRPLNPLFPGLSSEASAIHSSNTREYESFLKQRLDLACAAVAWTRATSFGAPKKHVPSNELHQNNEDGNVTVVDAVRIVDSKSSYNCQNTNPLGIPPLPPKSGDKSRLGNSRTTTSGSSREQSDDEDDLDFAANELNMRPNDLKRVKRMLSNRESARRSRRRKQAHLSDLEMQVAQLQVENSALLKQLTEISQKFHEAAIDNRVLKSDVEALQAKLKMAEVFLARNATSNAQVRSMSSGKPPAFHKNDQGLHFIKSGYNAPVDLQIKCTEAPNTHSEHWQASRSAGFTTEIMDAHHTQGSKMERTPSMQRVASLEHLQKRIRGGASAL